MIVIIAENMHTLYYGKLDGLLSRVKVGTASLSAFHGYSTLPGYNVASIVCIISCNACMKARESTTHKSKIDVVFLAQCQ